MFHGYYLLFFVLCLGGLYDVFFMGTKKTSGILFINGNRCFWECRILNILFVPKYGIWATAISTLLAAVVLLGVRIYQLRKEVHIHFHSKEIVLLLVVLVLASLLYGVNGYL